MALKQNPLLIQASQTIGWDYLNLIEILIKIKVITQIETLGADT